MCGSNEWADADPQTSPVGSSGEQLRFTLKAFANLSPGFALKPWVKKAHLFRRNSEGVATGLRFGGRRRNPDFVGVASSKTFGCVFPRVAKAQPRAEISERFQR